MLTVRKVPFASLLRINCAIAPLPTVYSNIEPFNTYIHVFTTEVIPTKWMEENKSAATLL